MSSANPVSLPSGYRVSIVRNTNIDQIETTPLQYCKIRLNTPTWPGQVSLQDRPFSLQVYIWREAWEIAEERQWSVSHLWLLKSGSGYCRTFLYSVTQAAKEAGETTCRTLPCSVSGQLKTWRGMGDLVGITGCIFKIKVMCGGQSWLDSPL